MPIRPTGIVRVGHDCQRATRNQQGLGVEGAAVSEQHYDVGTFVIGGAGSAGATTAEPSRRPTRRWPNLLSNILAIATTLAVVLTTGTVVVAYRQLSGGGPQPEKYAPASTFAFAKIDLDPAASTKVAAYRFARKFDSSVTDKLKDADDLRDRALRLVFKNSDPTIGYDKDIKPWLGARVGVAGFTDKASKPQFVVISQVRDQGKAKSALKRIAAGAPDKFGYRVLGDYALFSEKQAVVDEAASAAEARNLDGNARFNDDVGALGGAQIITAWADLAGAQKAVGESFIGGDLAGGLGLFALPSILGGFAGSSGSGFGIGSAPPAPPVRAPGSVGAPSAQCSQEFQRLLAKQADEQISRIPFDELSPKCRAEFLGPRATAAPAPRALSSALLAPTGSQEKLTGRIALGVHIASNHVDIKMRTVGTTAPKQKPVSVRDLVAKLPDDTVAAIAFGGLDDVRAALKADDQAAGLDAVLAPLRLSLDDVLSVFGNSAVIALGNVPGADDAPLVALRSRPNNLYAANNALASAISNGLHVVSKLLDDGTQIISTTDAYADKLAKGGNLGSTQRFQQAIASLDGTVVALGYVDLRRILAKQQDKGGTAAPLTAVGLIATQDGDVQEMQVRVVAD